MAEGKRLISLALFGQPVAASLSPAIHRQFAAQLGLEIEYRAVEAGVDDFLLTPVRSTVSAVAGPDGQALAVALYEAGGVRGCEIGSAMFGLQPDGSEQPAAMELVRLAILRRTYTQSHIDFVAEVVIDVGMGASLIVGYRIVEQAPWLRHFTARFEPV